MKTCKGCIHNKPTGRTYEQYASYNPLIKSKFRSVIRTWEQCQKEHPMPLSIKDAAKCPDYKWAGDGKDYVVHIKAKGGFAAYTETRKRGS